MHALEPHFNIMFITFDVVARRDFPLGYIMLCNIGKLPKKIYAIL